MRFHLQTALIHHNIALSGHVRPSKYFAYFDNSIPVQFRLQASVPNFRSSMEWTARDWKSEMDLMVLDRHQNRSCAQAEGAVQEQPEQKHWLFGYPETYNPETIMKAHELLLQSWTDSRVRGWCWGDLDALLLSIPKPLEDETSESLPQTQTLLRQVCG